MKIMLVTNTLAPSPVSKNEERLESKLLRYNVRHRDRPTLWKAREESEKSRNTSSKEANKNEWKWRPNLWTSADISNENCRSNDAFWCAPQPFRGCQAEATQADFE
jgi:hypothetical protein